MRDHPVVDLAERQPPVRGAGDRLADEVGIAGAAPGVPPAVHRGGAPLPRPVLHLLRDAGQGAARLGRARESATTLICSSMFTLRTERKIANNLSLSQNKCQDVSSAKKTFDKAECTARAAFPLTAHRYRDSQYKIKLAGSRAVRAVPAAGYVTCELLQQQC